MKIDEKEEYIPRDDESEVGRLEVAQGVGEVNYLTDEDVRHYSMSDFGLSIGEPMDRDFR